MKTDFQCQFRAGTAAHQGPRSRTRRPARPRDGRLGHGQLRIRRIGALVERQSESAGTTDYYFYAGSQVVETRETTSGSGESAAAAPVQYQYVWSPGGDTPICRDTINSSGQVVADDRIYYLTDANDNVTALVGYNQTAGAWQVVERYVYTPFGGVTIYACSGNSWTQAGAPAYNNTIFFAGMSLDPATGLYYDHARWYDPGSGAFITRDPMGYAAGDANLYRYCGNNPISATDPTGLDQVSFTVQGGTAPPPVNTTGFSPGRRQPSRQPGRRSRSA